MFVSHQYTVNSSVLDDCVDYFNLYHEETALRVEFADIRVRVYRDCRRMFGHTDFAGGVLSWLDHCIGMELERYA